MSHTTAFGGFYHGTFVKRSLPDFHSSRRIGPGNACTGLHTRCNEYWRNGRLRASSSGADARNTSEEKQSPIKDGASLGNEKKSRREAARVDSGHADVHAWLGEQDQKEWLSNEKIAMENKKKESPFVSRRERFRNEFLRRVVPWKNILVSWETFPYYINENDKNILVECVSSHLKNKSYTASHGARLPSSNGRILLQTVPGSELYRERIVKALARDLQVPLLVLDSSVLSPFDSSNDCYSECESDDNPEPMESSSETEVEDDTDATDEERWTSSSKPKSDTSDDEDVSVEGAAEAALKKLIPGHLEDFEKRGSGESGSSSMSTKSETAEPLKRGDRVKYVGPSVCSEADSRPLSSGQPGEVYDVSGDQVAVVLDTVIDGQSRKEQRDVKLRKQDTEQQLHWLNVKDVELDPDSEAEDCFLAMEVLCEVLDSMNPLIVYFPDYSLWLSRGVPKSIRQEFVKKVKEMFDLLKGPFVLICGQNKVKPESKENVKLTMVLRSIGRLEMPLPLKNLTEGYKATTRSINDEIHTLFTNVLRFYPPKEEGLIRMFVKQLEEDRKIVLSRRNIKELHKVLKRNEMSCVDLLHVYTSGVVLTKKKAEKVVGWAKNHHLSSCLAPHIKGELLLLPLESLEIAITRLKEREDIFRKPSQILKKLAKDKYEISFVSAVVPPGEIGVKFDDIGALEEVKKTLNLLVILPMQRPELFTHGNLLRPSKGLLLFGPPGTGKTLLAKAIATEAGASFISITGSNLTSKWFGESEKFTKALFSFASKLAPVIIFIDEVDSLLGARGGASEHEATRRMKNEFMAAWDGLRSRDSQRIVILGATNRPFDLDDAVIRRFPRRIYVDLPDAENRVEILQVILKQENLEAGFQFDKLANATEGYSGSDLKNLCIAAAYRQVEELLEKETKGGQRDISPTIRPLTLDDFIQSMAKVGPSVAFAAVSMNDLRKWNELYGEGGSRRVSSIGF